MPRRFLRLLVLAALLSSAGAFWFARVAAAEAASPLPNRNLPLWQSIIDYQDKHSFEIYGPPLPENAKQFEQEQRLYEDMVNHFDEVGEDETDFTFIVEAYSVPVEVFRPDIIRPQGEAEKEDAENPFGEDDPLGEKVKSTSAYVDEVRPTFLPGEPLKMHKIEESKPGDDGNHMGSLFGASDKLKAEQSAPPKPAQTPKPAETAAAGAIDQPKKKGPLPGSDEETLANLKKAVHELGLEKQLNFDATKQKMAPGDDQQAAGPQPAGQQATNGAAAMPGAPTPAVVPPASKPVPVVKAKPKWPKKKPVKKELPRRKPARPVHHAAPKPAKPVIDAPQAPPPEAPALQPPPDNSGMELDQPDSPSISGR